MMPSIPRSISFPGGIIQVSVVIPTYRRPQFLRRCLEAMVGQDLMVPFEVIVADDGPDTATEQTVQHFSKTLRIQYLPVRNTQGPAAARNAAWRVAKGEIIAFTDDDTIPSASWLRKGIEGLVQQKANAGRGRVTVPLPLFPTDYERNVRGLEEAEFVTANCFCRKMLLERVGGFDERFRRAWREDSDLHFKLIEAGENIVLLHDAAVQHPVRPASWGISFLEQRNNFYEALLFKKHPALYYEKIGQAPLGYYLTVILGVAVPVFYNLGHPMAAAVCLGGWLWHTARFFQRRMKDCSRRPSHLLEMALTSALIPPVAIFWRLSGALKFRQLFW
jgi:glycosyltransferase involved in cell wall biosynthesis